VVALLYDWDWQLAQDELERAMSLPSTSAFAHHWYALFLSAMGRGEQALQVARRAHLLDPLSLTVQVTVYRTLYYLRRFDEAITGLRAHLDLNPTSLQGHLSLARALMASGAPDEAVARLEQALNTLGWLPILIAFAGQAHAQAGQRDQALGLLGELRDLAARRYVPLHYQLVVIGGLGDLDETFRLYQLLVDQRSGWLAFLRVDPILDPLRADPRFIALLQKLRLDF
jgi:tetratricopeptide (TPR) repeat protein